MQLKRFQVAILDTVSAFAKILRAQRDHYSKIEAMCRQQGIDAPAAAVGKAAWEAAKRIGYVSASAADWIERHDPLKREVYSICLKVPTGGGKTILGAYSIGKLHESFYEKKSGLVLWVVPSEAIYSQTLRAFNSSVHPYRVALETAAGGRLKILTKVDRLSKDDVENNLCVLIVMLQSTVREEAAVLKIFRDSGAFQGFFPNIEDDFTNRALRAAIPNLEVLESESKGIPGVSVRHSLANVLRCCCPLIVIDEGHRAYTDLARNTLLGLNPSMILELTATPNIDELHSNLLVAVSGVELKNADLIKLPINIDALIGDKWQRVVSTTMLTRAQLEKAAVIDQKKTGRKIRPIALIRVEATGKRRAGDTRVHADDVKEYLVKALRIPEKWIRLKTASINEIGEEDLLADACEVRVILTKDALREGWDCPCAYVLAVLTRRTGATAITQMTGRVLRQPGARPALDPQLNEAYVVCLTEDVQKSVAAVSKGLEEEGLGDVGSWVKFKGGSAGSRVVVKRSRLQRGSFLLPEVAIKVGTDWTGFDPERHLYPLINWRELPMPDFSDFPVAQASTGARTTIGLRSVGGKPVYTFGAVDTYALPVVADEYVSAVEILRSLVPNAWIAFDLIRKAEEIRCSKGAQTQQLVAQRIQLALYLVQKFSPIVDKLLEHQFRKLAGEGTIKLLASVQAGFGVTLPASFDLSLQQNDAPLLKAGGTPLDKNVFEKVYRSELNSLELGAVRAIDAAPSTVWWWRVPVKGVWSLRGWRKDHIYPDFAVRAKHESSDYLIALETKGAHLTGNDDSTYKSAVLKVLDSVYQSERPATLKKGTAAPEVATAFRGALLEEVSWQTDLVAVLPAAPLSAPVNSHGRGSGGTVPRRRGRAGRTS